mmetsp:Transcript_29158/g.61994  ORF Transcript_29158/g.61994 Transcript_29158/m.61994 type:complete len:379 (+) Transcript_29158:84-1220(+)
MYLYNADAGLLFTCFNLINSVVPKVLCRPSFWFLLGVHCALTTLQHLEILEESDDNGNFLSIGKADLSLIMPITIFFEVFYPSQCYSRYMQTFNDVKSILFHVRVYSIQLKTHCGTPELRPQCRLALRYLLASVMSFFFEIHSQSTEDEWDMVLDEGLLTQQEVAFLDTLPCSRDRHMHLLHWSFDVLKMAFSKSTSPPNVMKDSINVGLKISQLQSAINDIITMPVPFQYFQLLNMMVTFVLLIMSYAMSHKVSFFGSISFFLIELVLIGMLEVAIQLSDPFGEDDVDFSVHDWALEHASTAINIIEMDFAPLTESWASVLARERPLKLKGSDRRSLQASRTVLSRGSDAERDLNLKPAKRSSRRSESPRYTPLHQF